MDESFVFERPTQGQVNGDLRELFRGTIRLTLEMLLAEVVKEMWGPGATSE